MRRFMRDLGELSGLDIATAALPMGATSSALRIQADSGGRPVLHGSALLRAIGFEAPRDGRCRAVDPTAPALLREAAVQSCALPAGA